MIFASVVFPSPGGRQIFFDFALPDELAQPLWPQLQLKRRIVFHRRRRHQPVGVVIQIGIFRGRHWADIITPHEKQAPSFAAKKLCKSIVECEII
jgi:hypothetical protein